MTPRSIEEYRAPGSTASLEDDWIAAVEAEPENLDSFLDLAQALITNDEAERARGLLELYDAELKSRALFSTRLELLRRAGLLVLKPNKLQREILATLEGIWSEETELQVDPRVCRPAQARRRAGEDLGQGHPPPEPAAL